MSTQATTRPDPPTAQTRSRLKCAALSQTRGEPVREFLLIPFGEVTVERPIAGEDFVFTRAHAEAARHWFSQMGRKLAIDYEHQSFDRLNSRCDGLRPAAGWIGGLEVRDDGLWATDVTWTDRAAELLRTGEYRYFSPVIFWTTEDHTEIAALGPVALTNDPAMRGVTPLAASKQPEESSDDVQAALAAAQEEISLLRRQLALEEANAFIERGLRLGKIVDSTSTDWRDDYLRDPEVAEQRLSRAPVLLPPGRMIALDRHGHIAPVQKPTLHSKPSHNHIDLEDLAAFEQAAAAGRVLAPRA